jgi:hypothetical protein
MIITIVPSGKIEKNPETLLYHFPSMHPVRYQKLIQEYTFWKHVETAEKVARMAGKYLVPRDCIHWERKSKFDDRRIIIQKKAFFVLDESEMSKAELRRFQLSVVS